ncbi:MAG TPA: DUF6264 family protein [Pseudolysinimonas sp.]|nr:DUF6264 family protein [Pseudolysinimonas sp.]
MSDPTPPPVPQYGEIAPPGYVPPQQPVAYGQPLAPMHPSGRRRRVWDLVLTCVFLVIGLVGMFFGVIYGFLFSSPDLVDQVFDQALSQQGISGWNGSVGSASAVLLISHIGLYLVAVGLSIFLLVTRRIAFWVPLTVGVIAAIIFWATIFSVMLSDPDLMSRLS